MSRLGICMTYRTKTSLRKNGDKETLSVIRLFYILFLSHDIFVLTFSRVAYPSSILQIGTRIVRSWDAT